jgi:hypothetical protein
MVLAKVILSFLQEFLSGVYQIPPVAQVGTECPDDRVEVTRQGTAAMRGEFRWQSFSIWEPNVEEFLPAIE